MFYAAYNDTNGERQAKVYNNYKNYYNDTFSPDIERLAFVEFVVHGKTYAERKESIRNTAIDFQTADSEVSGGLTYSEYAEVSGWFERNGRKYGLLTEFRENAIC
jgi:hypothetical protein